MNYGNLRIFSVYGLLGQRHPTEEDYEELIPERRQTILMDDQSAKSPGWNSQKTNMSGRIRVKYSDNPSDVTMLGSTTYTFCPD